ncbi:MAG TPA: XRE family transcriptional regulator [Candidatus Aminicenantes bacterium]|nr:XRE family transcriptional regulator [Candidatus Aminicenantes bacterium]HRY65815.1 XRE family transcriptional regulator [Candidatus Aminicenantes bacterium]HRZ72729.1 XRE family transcriptional regulator [Candidatus Aminicenantes bacterium]
MDKLLGTRLRRAREEINLSQGAFAKSLGLSSEYISLLESGKRTPSFETLLKVAGFLNKNVSYFFEDRRPAFERLPGGAETSERLRRDLQKFRAACERYLELEEATGRRLELAPRYPRIAPERLAEEERRRLGLGSEPIRDILGLCEINGLRIIRQTLADEDRISGLFIFDDERQAAFALINANEPAGLQTGIAAHLYGHYLMDRDDGPIVDGPDVVVDEYVSLYPPREQYAQTFASRFLVPPDKLQELVEKDVRTKTLGFDDVLFLKRYFGVSTRAMLRTLRGRGFLAESKFEEFFKRGPEDREQEVFGSLAGQEERRTRTLFRKSRTIPSDRYRLLASEAAALERARAAAAPAPPKTGGPDE